MKDILKDHIQELIEVNSALHEIASIYMRRGIDCRNDKTLFSAFMLGKSYKSHEAIIMLCKNGYGEDAFILSRALFESMVVLSYIMKDETDEKLSRYFEYDWVTRKEMFDHLSSKDDAMKHFQLQIEAGIVDKNLLQEVRTEYERVMKKYKYDSRKGWSDKSIRGMSIDIGREDAYASLYKLQCNMSHNNPRTLNEYIERTADGYFIDTGSTQNMIDSVLVCAFDCFVTILHIASQQIGWENFKEINDLNEKMVTLMKKIDHSISY